VIHCFFFSYGRVRYSVALFALAAMLAACGGQPPTINPENAVSITRTNGAATLTQPLNKTEKALPENTLLVPGDHLYTASDQTVTLQFPDGSTLQMGPDSHVVLFDIGSADHMALFRLLAGSVTGVVRSRAFEVQGYKEVALNFSMVVTDLAAVPRDVAGTYQLGFDGNLLKAVVNSGEFDVRSGNQQATLPSGWQAIAEPGKPMQIVPLITPTPAAGAPSATPIQIISITPTNTPTTTPSATGTATATKTSTPTPTRTRVRRPVVTTTPPLLPTGTGDTPVPPATEKPDRPPKSTNPPPTNPPPTNPPPTNPPPTAEPPTPRPTVG
jgi:hypothetical protein